MKSMITLEAIIEKSKENKDKYNVPPFVACPTSMKIWCPYLKKCNDDKHCYWGDNLKLIVTCKLEREE